MRLQDTERCQLQDLPAPPVVTTVYQGEFKISADPNECLVTILGSCVATCFYDPIARVGGVNHFLLPNGSASDGSNLRYGIHSMELLINGLLKAGVAKKELRAKVFGGAQMLDEFSNIGERNAEFAFGFLDAENIPCVSKSTLGNQARRIKFWPATGRVQQLLVARTEVPKPQKAPSTIGPSAADIELF